MQGRKFVISSPQSVQTGIVLRVLLNNISECSAALHTRSATQVSGT